MPSKDDCIVTGASRLYKTQFYDAIVQEIKKSEDGEAEVSQESKQDKLNIEFPDQIQFSYEDNTTVYRVDQLENIGQKYEGYFDDHRGIKHVADPEKYIDTGFNIVSMERDEVEGDDNVCIWTRINAEASLEYFHVSQHWWWSKKAKPGAKPDKRQYSYLGLFRKFCEADIHELLRLKKQINNQLNIKKFEEEILYANFHSKSVFAIFYSDVQFLQAVINWLG